MAADDDALLLHSNLSRWIEQNGGKIHKNLGLHSPSQSTTADYTHRGIFALKGPILKGEELIRLPAALALDGNALPLSYLSEKSSATNKSASNWLRCIASLMHTLYQCKRDAKSSSSAASSAEQEQPSVKYTHYITSLPKKYDSLLEWTTWEIRTFLAGTALSVNALQSVTGTGETSEISESQHNDALRLRYRTTVVPYLKYLQQNLGMFLSEENESIIIGSDTNLIDREKKRQKRTETQQRTKEFNFEELYPLFRESCMCISSRAFHMQQLDDARNETDVADSKIDYHGPYLLPYIDLLNHSPQSSPKHVTTLHRSATDGSFVMIAERDIAVGEEICHSYDVGNGIAENESNSSFTSAQTLQTYGFVDLEQTCIIDFFLNVFIPLEIEGGISVLLSSSKNLNLLNDK